MVTPYIGITGFKSYEEVVDFNRRVSGHPVGYLMYGFTSSNKRLADPVSSGKTSPSLCKLGAAIAAVPTQHLPMVHYHTPNQDKLADEILSLFEFCMLDPARVGLQINALWPEHRQLERLQHFTITLQLPAKALAVENIVLIDKLQSYKDLVEYALIDPSSGQGVDFNIDRAANLLRMMQRQVPQIIPGVAGGFSPSNVTDRVKAIREASK